MNVATGKKLNEITKWQKAKPKLRAGLLKQPRTIFARSYLYRASLLFQSVHDLPPSADAQKTEEHHDEHRREPCISPVKDHPGSDEGSSAIEPLYQQNQKPQPSFLSRQYASQLQAVSLKSQLKLSQNIKRSLCNRCHTLLLPGSTCAKQIENKSRGGKKPGADVLVVGCHVCGARKRYPQVKK